VGRVRPEHEASNHLLQGAAWFIGLFLEFIMRFNPGIAGIGLIKDTGLSPCFGVDMYPLERRQVELFGNILTPRFFDDLDQGAEMEPRWQPATATSCNCPHRSPAASPVRLSFPLFVIPRVRCPCHLAFFHWRLLVFVHWRSLVFIHWHSFVGVVICRPGSIVVSTSISPYEQSLTGGVVVL
jgi:hypothetical protein